MLQDQHELALSTSSTEAAASFDRTILAYLKYRTDTPQHLARTFAADPEFGLAHCLAGYFAMLSYNLGQRPSRCRGGSNCACDDDAKLLHGNGLMWRHWMLGSSAISTVP